MNVLGLAYNALAIAAFALPVLGLVLTRRKS